MRRRTKASSLNLKGGCQLMIQCVQMRNCAPRTLIVKVVTSTAAISVVRHFGQLHKRSSITREEQEGQRKREVGGWWSRQVAKTTEDRNAGVWTRSR